MDVLISNRLVSVNGSVNVSILVVVSVLDIYNITVQLKFLRPSVIMQLVTSEFVAIIF